MSVKLLTEHHLEFLSLKIGCTCSSGSTLVKMSHCWKSHVHAAHIFLDIFTKHGKSCDLDNIVILSLPHPMHALYEIRL